MGKSSGHDNCEIMGMQRRAFLKGGGLAMLAAKEARALNLCPHPDNKEAVDKSRY